ncbi:MAG: hypothetical protein V7K68_30960 [Nostoc sp.]
MGIGHWGLGIGKKQGSSKEVVVTISPLHHAQCPMPNAQCPIPNN